MIRVRAYILVICLFFFAIGNAQSIIVESSTISEINNFILHHRKQQHILIVVDLDETIVTNTTALGTDPWFYAYLNKLIAHGLASDYARTLMRSLNINVQKYSKLRLIEEYSPKLIEQWQAHGIHVIALTARAARLAEHTAQQLHSFGINFNLHTNYAFSLPEHACYHKGIVCCGPHNKGTILSHWLAVVGIKPDLIIFVDDKLKNIHDVQNALDHSISFIGIRYNRCDEQIKNFNFTPTIAELEKLYDTHPEIERLPVAVAA